MNYWVSAVAAFLIGSGACADEIEDSCRACHRGELALDEWEPGALAARLRAMREGEADHVVPIPALGDEEILALAKALAAR